MWDFSAILSTFAVPGGVTVTRHSAGSRVNGHYVPATGTTVTLDPCVINAMSGRMQRRLQWTGTSEAIVVLANQPLYTLDEPSGRQADTVDWKGHTYECKQATDVGDLANYWRGIFTKVAAT